MATYFFKTSREIETGEVRVQDVQETSRAVKPYHLRRTRRGQSGGVVETMQVFVRKADALAAHLLEKEAAELSRRDFDEVQQEALGLLASFKTEWRIPVEGVARMIDVKPVTLRSYYSGRAMNPRVMLRVKKLHEYLTDACRRASAVLPVSGDTGCAAKGRGKGNPDIWRFAPNHRKKQTA